MKLILLIALTALFFRFARPFDAWKLKFIGGYVGKGDDFDRKKQDRHTNTITFLDLSKSKAKSDETSTDVKSGVSASDKDLQDGKDSQNLAQDKVATSVGGPEQSNRPGSLADLDDIQVKGDSIPEVKQISTGTLTEVEEASADKNGKQDVPAEIGAAEDSTVSPAIITTYEDSRLCQFYDSSTSTLGLAEGDPNRFYMKDGEHFDAVLAHLGPGNAKYFDTTGSCLYAHFLVASVVSQYDHHFVGSSDNAELKEYLAKDHNKNNMKDALRYSQIRFNELIHEALVKNPTVENDIVRIGTFDRLQAPAVEGSGEGSKPSINYDAPYVEDYTCKTPDCDEQFNRKKEIYLGINFIEQYKTTNDLITTKKLKESMQYVRAVKIAINNIYAAEKARLLKHHKLVKLIKQRIHGNATMVSAKLVEEKDNSKAKIIYSQYGHGTALHFKLVHGAESVKNQKGKYELKYRHDKFFYSLRKVLDHPYGGGKKDKIEIKSHEIITDKKIDNNQSTDSEAKPDDLVILLNSEITKKIPLSFIVLLVNYSIMTLDMSLPEIIHIDEEKVMDKFLSYVTYETNGSAEPKTEKDETPDFSHVRNFDAKSGKEKKKEGEGIFYNFENIDPYCYFMFPYADTFAKPDAFTDSKETSTESNDSVKLKKNLLTCMKMNYNFDPEHLEHLRNLETTPVFGRRMAKLIYKVFHYMGPRPKTDGKPGELGNSGANKKTVKSSVNKEPTDGQKDVEWVSEKVKNYNLAQIAKQGANTCAIYSNFKPKDKSAGSQCDPAKDYVWLEDQFAIAASMVVLNKSESDSLAETPADEYFQNTIRQRMMYYIGAIKTDLLKAQEKFDGDKKKRKDLRKQKANERAGIEPTTPTQVEADENKQKDDLTGAAASNLSQRKETDKKMLDHNKLPTAPESIKQIKRKSLRELVTL